MPTGDAKMAAGRQMTVAESRLWGGVGGFLGGADMADPSAFLDIGYIIILT